MKIKKNKEELYSPLPDSVTIKNSKIHGLGLFAKKNIPKDYCLGITHVKDNRFENGYIRTPLGGFFNHSENPNCEAFEYKDFIILKTLREIKSGEELLAYYWLYNI